MDHKVNHLDKTALIKELEELRKREKELEQRILELDAEIYRLKQFRLLLKSELNKVKKRITELENIIEMT